MTTTAWLATSALAGQWVGAALTGLAASLHCFGMCGGLQAALAPGVSGHWPGLWRLQVGRSVSYVLLGVAGGGTGQVFSQAVGQVLGVTGGMTPHWALALRLLATGVATFALLSLALRLLIGRDVFGLERLGHFVWRMVQPAARWAGRWPEPWGSLGMGMAWAFIPCGLVLSMTLLAAGTGQAWQGGALLGAFALGTWPAMLSAGRLGRLGLFSTGRPQRRLRWTVGLALLLLITAQWASLRHYSVAHHHHPNPPETAGATPE